MSAPWKIKTPNGERELKLKIIKADPKSKFLVVTPLYEGHKLSHDTKTTIKRNNYPFTWILAEGRNNIPTNTFGGIEWYLHKKGKVPDFYIMIDRDVRLGRNMLDRLYDKLSKAPLNIAYSYASFKFVGAINRDFPATQWDINKLLLHNYISSNSMFRTNALYEVGLVMDDRYKRLLDWAYLLKLFLERGYMGIPCPEANFEAIASPDSISSGSAEEYNQKRINIIDDFCKPIIQKYAHMQEARQKAIEKQKMQPQHQETTTVDF